MRLARAIDLWLGELSRAGRQDGTLDSYRRHLNKLMDQLERTRPDVDVREVTTNDCRAFMDGWRGRAASTVCAVHSADGLFEWLFLEGEVDANPMARIKRPRRPRLTS
jgi:site-specific recombinase XerC